MLNDEFKTINHPTKDSKITKYYPERHGNVCVVYIMYYCKLRYYGKSFTTSLHKDRRGNTGMVLTKDTVHVYIYKTMQ